MAGKKRTILGAAYMGASIIGGAPIGAVIGGLVARNGLRAMEGKKKSGISAKKKTGGSRSAAARTAALARWHGGGKKSK